MDTEIFTQIGLSEIQAKIYLYLIKHGQKTPTEIGNDIGENRTTVYSAAEKLVKLGIISPKDRGKITAYIPNHPSSLETLAEKRLRVASKQAKNLEGNLPSLINYYNEHQHQPGTTTFYGQEGIDFIRDKIISTGQTFYFVRSRHDGLTDPESTHAFIKARVEANIHAKNITSFKFAKMSKEQAEDCLLDRTVLPSDEYDSPVEIEIFGDNVAFINYAKNGMSTIIESPEIADAMRQFFDFSTKYIKKATDQSELQINT